MSKEREDVSILVTVGLIGLVIVVVIASYCYQSIKQSYEQHKEQSRKKVVEVLVTQDVHDEENVKKARDKMVEGKSSISIDNEERLEE